MRREQQSFYLRHGVGGLKNVKGRISIPASVDYILSASEEYAKIETEQFSLTYPDERMICLGFPCQDALFRDNHEELEKVTSKNYKKVILWMPTFRKGGGSWRNDSESGNMLGVPLIQDIDEYNKLNELLKRLDYLLIIKIHPMQDLSDLSIRTCSNIIVLTALDVKRLDIDNYKLMTCTDALISDYSGAANDYLHLNRPIAYVLSDIEEYKIGFIVEDIHTLMAGKEIYTFDELIAYISGLFDEDVYREQRESLRNKIYKYHDGHSCKRLAEFMNL